MLGVLLSLNAMAYDACINGIYYNVLKKTHFAEVTWGDKKYTGDVVIPKSIEYEGVLCNVSSIGRDAFRECKEMTSVSVPSSITEMGVYAFYGCENFAVHITDIAAWCNISFYDYMSNPLNWCHHLYVNGEEVTDLVIPNGVTSISDCAFMRCGALTSLTIPNSVTSIGSEAFYGCRGLTAITIPNSVSSIGNSAFYGCSGLTAITIPNSVTSVGNYAFSGCKNIEDLYCYAEKVPSTYENAFQDAYVEFATLHVPAASVETYKSTAPWSSFGKIVALEGDAPEEPETPKCETPTIAYENGELVFSCATKGAEFISEITDEDIKKHYDSKVELKAAYLISVYATATGYDNSETATATLCWIDTDPKTEDITDKIAEVAAYPVLIQSQNGQITVKGAADNTPVAVYTTAGAEVGNAISSHGTATISANLPSGTTAIVKIGTRSVKVLVK